MVTLTGCYRRGTELSNDIDIVMTPTGTIKKSPMAFFGSNKT